MKANELMIGDWVRIPHINKIGKVYRIDQANGDGNGFAAVINGDYHESLLEPIPLTPEILEKNGFESSKVFVEWKYENDNVYIIYKPFPYLKIQTEECIVAFPCEYIHQLQHALRLCGIDKEIKL